MSMPLTVRQIRHVLQQKVVPLLDLSDDKVRRASIDESAVLTRALAAAAIWEHSGCTLKEAVESIVDGGGDGGIDAIHISHNPPRIYIVQSKWSNKGNATLNSEAVNKLRDGFAELTQGDIDHLNSRVKQRWDRFRQVQMNPEHKAIIIGALLGNDPVHADQQRGLRKIGQVHGEEFFEYRYMHLVDFRRLIKHGMSRQTPELQVSLRESFHRESRADRNGKIVRQESYSGTVLARDVSKWVGTFGERLFDQNIRGSLGDTGVNEKIRATLQNSSESFWDLNKGITLVADTIKRTAADSGSYSAPAHLTLPGASIIDGAQTASSIHKVLVALSAPGLVGEAEVPIKIISIEGAPPDYATRIAFAANTQNAILQRDFASADEAQEELQFELDQLGKRYVYKRSETLTISNEDTCRIEEVAVALVCLQGNAKLLGRVKRAEDTLWDQADKVYQTIFHPVPDARVAWNATLFLRGILRETEDVAKVRTGRARNFAQSGNWLTCHILLRLIDEDLMKEATEGEWREQIVKSRRLHGQVLDRLIHHADATFGSDSYAEAIFRDENRCKTLAGLVLSDMRRGTPEPNLQPSDRARERARNTVEYIHDFQMLDDGAVLQFKSHTKSRRDLAETWMSEHPQLARATWSHSHRRLRWEGDGKRHAPSPLAIKIIGLITGREPSSVRGPDCWVAPDGRTLTQLAEEAKRRSVEPAK